MSCKKQNNVCTVVANCLCAQSSVYSPNCFPNEITLSQSYFATSVQCLSHIIHWILRVWTTYFPRNACHIWHVTRVWENNLSVKPPRLVSDHSHTLVLKCGMDWPLIFMKRLVWMILSLIGYLEWTRSYRYDILLFVIYCVLCLQIFTILTLPYTESCILIFIYP